MRTRAHTLHGMQSIPAGEKEVDTIHTPGGMQKHVCAGQPEGVILTPPSSKSVCHQSLLLPDRDCIHVT